MSAGAVPRTTGIFVACAALGATTGCFGPSKPADFGIGAELCAIVATTEFDSSLGITEPGEPQRIWGIDAGVCRWRSPDFENTVTLTVSTEPRGAEAAQASRRPGRPAPSVGPGAVIDEDVNRLGWTVRVSGWIGGANTFELDVETDTRLTLHSVERLAAEIADRLRANPVVAAADGE
ncbi:hypothetical protein [Antrihabitans spumae]|jgi:hypothetical protein|uniref:DUF3558 domain-containing protein n=1 Tax=Antrihabitans spumae TaxID=3373370 RepID=A0ABW7KFZ1_9NOCA